MNSIIGKGGFVYVNLTGLVYSTDVDLVEGSKTIFPGMHKMLEDAMKTGKTIIFQSMTRHDSEDGDMMLGIASNNDEFYIV